MYDHAIAAHGHTCFEDHAFCIMKEKQFGAGISNEYEKDKKRT